MTIALDDLFGSAPPVKPVPVECPGPGIHYDVPAHIYHQWGCVSSTLIKNFAKRPSTCRDKFIPSDDVNVGSGIHCYTLMGPENLETECIIGPAFGKGKSDVAARQELIDTNPDKSILPPMYGSPAPGLPIMDVLSGVDSELRKHPKIGKVLDNSEKEVSLVWVDPGSGVLCKARLDIWEGKELTIWDIKKCKSITSLKYEMDSGYRYRLQSAHYLNGATLCGLNPVAFGFIACEAFPPFECRPFYSDPDKTVAAQEEVCRLIGLIKQSISMDYWPNFPPPPNIYDWNDLTPDDTIEII